MFCNFKHIIKNIFIRIKFHNKLIFPFSSDVSLKSNFDGANRIGENSYYKGYIGYGSYIGDNCHIYANIGKYCSIANYVTTNRGTHPYTEPFVSTSPMFFSVRKQNGYTYADRDLFDEILPVVTIGNDCWICQNVFVVGGVKISDGAVVLPGAVVTKDIPPYAVVGGVPAKVIRYRYDEETIQFLLDIKWWNLDVKWLQQHWELFSNINEFKSFIEKDAD